MGAVLSVLLSVQGTLLLGVLLAGLYMGYRAMLPKPLAGIPYNRDAAKKMFGDVPEMMGYVMRTQRIFVSCGPHAKHHEKTWLTRYQWIVLADVADGAAPEPHHPGLHQAHGAAVGRGDGPL
jgi:hypothetical protein